MEMKKLLLPYLALLTGCAQYCGVEPGTGTYGTPIYPPVYDVQPMRNAIYNATNEARKLKQFVGDDRNLIRVIWALEAYETANTDLLGAINTAPGATVTYTPWQMQNYSWRRN
jgi:hypothetical protein